MQISDVIERPRLGERFDPFGPGDSVIVNLRIVEGERERLQAFNGNVLHGSYNPQTPPQLGTTFTVRRVASGVGVERIIPFYSPLVESVRCVRRGRVRRARIYYLRNLHGKKARIRERTTPR